LAIIFGTSNAPKFEGMISEYHICRRARRDDIRRSMHLWGRDQMLYEPDVWSNFPTFLEDLMERDLVTFAFIESVPSKIPRLLGGLSFIRPEYIELARSGASTLPNVVMRAARQNRKPFLSLREVADQNARGELHCMNLFGNIDLIDLADPALADFYRTSNEGHRFFHFGYTFRSIWLEIWPPHHVHELSQLGMIVDRQLPLAAGRVASLMRLTREDARANPYGRFASYFFPPKPRFQFSLGEQRLLEYALLDASDEDAAQELHLSKDAIKKRWRSIHAKVETAAPELLDPGDSGVSRRRTLLHYVRRHLEELRPYRER
jgi:hypothetical protein